MRARVRVTVTVTVGVRAGVRVTLEALELRGDLLLALGLPLVHELLLLVRAPLRVVEEALDLKVLLDPRLERLVVAAAVVVGALVRVRVTVGVSIRVRVTADVRLGGEP